MAKNDSGALNVLSLTAVDLCAMMLKCGVKHLTPSAVGKWVYEGCPRNADKTFSLPNVTAWLINDRASVPHRPPAETDEMEKAKLEQVRERTKAIRQAREAEEKKLVSREETHEEWMRLLHGVKSGLTTLARVLVKEVIGQSEPVVKARVEARVNDTLRSFADGWDGAGDETPKGIE